MRATRRMIWVAFLAVALTATAAAQRGQPGQPQEPDKEKEPEEKREAKIGERAPSIKAASWLNIEGDVSLDRFKGRIILLFFLRTSDSASVEAINTLNKAYKDMGQKGVVIIGLTDEKKEKVESVIKGKEVKFPVGCEVQTEGTYNVSSYPRVYMIDTGGILKDNFHPGDDLAGKLQSQIAQTPPAGTDDKSLRIRLDRANEALKANQVGRAYTMAKDVSKLVDKESTIGQAAAKLIEQIEAAGKKLLEEAKRAVEAKDNEKAIAILAELSVRFEGSSISGDAESEIGKLLGNKELKPKVTKAKDNVKGELLLDQAADHEASKRYPEALKLYEEVTEKYGGTDAAKKADAAGDRIKSDPDAQKIIASLRADEEADRWLDLGDRSAKVEMPGKAREYYQRILDAHPDSRAAPKAKERLAKLPKEEIKEASAEDSPAGKEPKEKKPPEKSGTDKEKKEPGKKEPGKK